MKTKTPSPAVMEVFLILKLKFLLLLVLAVIVWGVQDFVASFAATEMTTSTTLRTVDERDDARVLRAYAQVKARARAKVTFETETNPQQQTRDAHLTFTANTKKDALEAREALVSGMRDAFAREGKGELFDVGHTPTAKPVQNHAYTVVKKTCQGIAGGILFFALAMLASRWKQSRLPREAVFGILASGFFTLLIMLGEDGASIWVALLYVGPPAALLVFVAVLMARVRRAATWVEGRARITSSKVVAEHHRFGGDTTKVRNLPAVEYEFDPGAGPIHGDRITLGSQPSDNVDEVVKRYPVGGSVPVFYDPRNPQDCVLERNPPASAGCIWSGTIFAGLVYEAVVLFFWNSVSINSLFNRAFPQLHHPLIVFITGSLGLFCLAVGIWFTLHPRKAFPWTRTKGTIVSSVTESVDDSDAGSGGRKQIYYRAVIEFSYQVDGHEYRGSTGSAAITVSGGKAGADAEVARYPVGMEVDIFYNPKKPTQSGLNVDTEMMLNGRASLTVAVVLLAVAIYAALS